MRLSNFEEQKSPKESRLESIDGLTSGIRWHAYPAEQGKTLPMEPMLKFSLPAWKIAYAHQKLTKTKDTEPVINELDAQWLASLIAIIKGFTQISQRGTYWYYYYSNRVKVVLCALASMASNGEYLNYPKVRYRTLTWKVQSGYYQYYWCIQM